MLVKDCIIETGVVRRGMLVRDVFAECGRTHVQALPVLSEKGKITGRVTLKSIMKFSCLPEYMVELAPLLGSFLSCVDNAEEKVNQVLCSQVDPYVLKAGTFIDPDAPAIKALAMMEKSDTSYLFVVAEGQYLGIITIQGIAERMSEMVTCSVDRVS
ncbi:MAG: CBS domain-containing protein [Candidatus Sedimenticola sp. (ex Thyasira tokunagai)]